MTDTENPEKLPKFLEDKIDMALLEKRRLFLSDGVDSGTAKDIIRKLWYLDSLAPGKPILFVINSPGGSVDSGFAIWDQIKMLSSPVVTPVTGLAASMGSVGLADTVQRTCASVAGGSSPARMISSSS